MQVLPVILVPPAKMATRVDLDQLDLRVNLVLPATMVLLAKTVSVTLVDPDLKEKLAHLDTLVNFLPVGMDVTCFKIFSAITKCHIFLNSWWTRT